MATQEELLARLEKLRRQRASGLRSMQAGDKRAEYRPDEELAAAIADLERQLAAASPQRVHTVMFSTSKGL